MQRLLWVSCLIMANGLVEGGLWHRFRTLVAGGGDASSDQTIPTTLVADSPPGFLTQGKVDTTLADNFAVLAQRMKKGESLNVLTEMAGHPDLDSIWSDPQNAFLLLQSNPVFKGLTGVGDIASKSQEELTSEDGQVVLESFRQFIAQASKLVQEQLIDPTGLVQHQADFQDRVVNDPDVKDLVAKTEAGDPHAALDLHDLAFDGLWGDALDKEHFGFAGMEPEATASLRDHVKENEPALWSLITQDDPLVEKILSDPFHAADLAAQMSAVQMSADGDLGDSSFSMGG